MLWRAWSPCTEVIPGERERELEGLFVFAIEKKRERMMVCRGTLVRLAIAIQ